MIKNIVVKGAREHNLKNIDVEIPRDKLVVFTGLSGSGKSSLAFDTIYAEGQRRYVESLSSYARQFLGQMEKPDVDYIEGLSPAISIDQKTTSRNPRSTVGTVTEIYDYLRLLWARIGIPYCPVCGREITQQTVDQIVDQILTLPEKTKIQIMAPIVRGHKGEYVKELDNARKSGFVRARIDGSVYDLAEEIKLDKNKKHNIEIVVDRLVMKPDIAGRLADSVETATHIADGVVLVDIVGEREELYSLNYACPEHGAVIAEMSPRMFSFNNPFGACKTCGGIGSYKEIDPALVIPNKKLSINQGAIKASGWNVADGGSIARMYFEAIAQAYKFSLDIPVEMIPKKGLDAILYGTGTKKLKMQRSTSYGSSNYNGTFEGVIPNLQRRYAETTSDWARADIEAVMTQCVCPDCGGARLSTESLSVTVGGKNIYEFCQMPIHEELDFIQNLQLTEKEQMIGALIVREIRDRLNFLNSVGLDYLSLAREAATLSGGESQRIRLATQIGSSLMGVLYILDEPSIGLHPSNIVGLTGVMHDLVDDGNSVILVDHDTQILKEADWIVEMGPEAGAKGGHVIAQGTIPAIEENPASQIGPFLSGKAETELRPRAAKEAVFADGTMHLSTSQIHTVKPLEVEIPKGRLTVVTGVSGSGKTTMVLESLIPALEASISGSALPAHIRAVKADGIAHVKLIDATPIGINVRSTVATYVGVHDELRKLYARSADAKERGYQASNFSYNTGSLRCPGCDGTGEVSLDVQFLPDVNIPCPDCRGSRYARAAYDVKLANKTGKCVSLPELMDMDVASALDFCRDMKTVSQKLGILKRLGLGYLTLGEETPSLSGGEAQRLKLASEIGKTQTDSVFVFDEPSIGLHPLDVRVLLGVFQALLDSGATVVVIEHDLDVIRNADHIIDMGPGGGDAGGRIIAAGTPDEIRQDPASVTGRYL